MAKHHVNPNTMKPGTCQAKTPENCRFSKEAGEVVAHYDTKEEAQLAAEKMIEKDLKNFETSLKKQKLPEVIDANSDFSQLEASDRADYAIFQGFKNDGTTAIGTINRSSYYGYVENDIDDKLAKDLEKFGIDRGGFSNNRLYRRHNILRLQELQENGYTADFVRHSFYNDQTSHFAGTFAEENDQVYHVTAKVVLTNPKGQKMVVPVTAQSTFSDLLADALDIEDDRLDAKTQNLVMKEAMKKALREDTKLG